MPEYNGPDPVVEITGVTEVARDLVVVPNRHIDLVPNIRVIGGTRSVLIVETGLGPGSAEKVLKFAADYGKDRRLYLTTTHFHPGTRVRGAGVRGGGDVPGQPGAGGRSGREGRRSARPG
jgi:hypothetical protein